MTGAQQPDALKRLVIFIIALAMLGAILALAGYFTADLTQQNSEVWNKQQKANIQATAPLNSQKVYCGLLKTQLNSCTQDCVHKIKGNPQFEDCLRECKELWIHYKKVCT